VIPRYSPGHRDRVEALELLLRSRAAGLHLAGPWVGGVSVEQVIARGRLVAGRILQGGPA
jgi:protoporphyrinogen oxidase